MFFEEIILLCSAVFMVVGMVTVNIMWNNTYEKNRMWKARSNNGTPQLSEKEQLLEQILHERDPKVISKLRRVIDKKNSNGSSQTSHSGSEDDCPTSFK